MFLGILGLKRNIIGFYPQNQLDTFIRHHLFKGEFTSTTIGPPFYSVFTDLFFLCFKHGRGWGGDGVGMEGIVQKQDAGHVHLIN